MLEMKTKQNKKPGWGPSVIVLHESFGRNFGVKTAFLI